MAPLRRGRPSASARSRQSTAALATAPAVELPPYEPPCAPLNAAGIYALESLSQKHDLRDLKEHLKVSHSTINDVVADMNETLAMRLDYVRHRKETRAARDPTATGPVTGEEDVEKLKIEVDDWVRKLEAKTRAVIDLRAEIEAGEAARREMATSVATGGGRLGTNATQSTLGASQFRSRQNASDDEEEANEGDGQASQVEGTSIVNALKRKAEEHHDRYQALSMSARYAKHNDYIGFKKFVHDASHPGEEKPPLPHASTWFNGSISNLGNTKQDPDQAEEADSSDVEAVTERVSIKCPLTLLPMKQPVTSQKCNHSFERDAILGMIAVSETRIGGGPRRGADGIRAMKCPVCQVMLVTEDLKPDPALKRKIERILAQQQRQDEDSEDDGEDSGRRGPQPEEIDSGDEGPASRRSLAHTVKSERTSIVPGTQLPDDDEEDEEEDEESPARPPPQSSAVVVNMEDEDDEEDDQSLYE